MKEQVLKLIQGNLIKEALDLLTEKSGDSSIVFFHARLSNLEDEYRKGTISFENYTIEKNKIISDILEWLKHFKVPQNHVKEESNSLDLSEYFLEINAKSTKKLETLVRYGITKSDELFKRIQIEGNWLIISPDQSTTKKIFDLIDSIEKKRNQSLIYHTALPISVGLFLSMITRWFIFIIAILWVLIVFCVYLYEKCNERKEKRTLKDIKNTLRKLECRINLKTGAVQAFNLESLQKENLYILTLDSKLLKLIEIKGTYQNFIALSLSNGPLFNKFILTDYKDEEQLNSLKFMIYRIMKEIKKTNE